METKIPLPSLWRDSQGISKKIIILFAIMIMSLLTLFLPYPISSFYTTSYAVDFSDIQEKPIVLQVRENNIWDIAKEYVAELEQNGYQNVEEELNSEKLDLTLGLKSVQQEFNQSKTYLLNAFNFYANYIQVSNNQNTYYFKTIDEANDFISNIKKYENTDYKIQEQIKKEIGSETKDEVLQETIKNAETAYKARLEEERKAKAAAAAKRSITDSSDISNEPIVQFATKFVGNPYVYGGTSLTNGADCSGFVQSVYKNFGISIPRGATSQYNAGTKISLEDIQPGDLIFYSHSGYGIDHVGMYIGGSKIVHAGKPSTGINICSANIMVIMGAVRYM